MRFVQFNGRSNFACLLALAMFLGWSGDALASPQYRAKLRVSDVSIYGSLTNFPVLVRLSEARIVGFSYADCAAKGADISFTLEDGTLLDHEIDTWKTDGESLVWVNLPVFARQASFYVRWKDPTPPTVSVPAVWTKAGYRAVWHFNEATGDAIDSVKGYVARPLGTMAADEATAFDAGAIGTARWCAHKAGTGSAQLYHSLVDLPDAELADPFTLSAWMYIEQKVGWWFANKATSAGVGFAGWNAEMYNAKMCPQLRGGDANTGYKGNQTPDCNCNRWMNMDFTYLDTAKVKFDIDGVSKSGGSAVVRDATSGYVSGSPLAIGSSSDGSQNALVGKVDELRIYGGDKSADWKTAETEQVNKSGFIGQVGTTETLGDCVLVRSVGTEFASSGSPAYGRAAASSGETYTFTAPASVPWQDGTVTATCTGWTLVRISDGSVVRTSESPAAGESVTCCIVSYAEPVQLSWKWSVAISEGPITYYVSPSGSGLDGLSWKTAFKHPQTALDAASGTETSPATILVGDGMYPELTVGHVHAVLSVTKSHVSVLSQNGPQVTVLDATKNETRDGKYAYRAIAVSEGLEEVLVSGFKVVNGHKRDDPTDGWYSATSLAAGSGVLSNLQVVVYGRNRCNPVYLKGTAALVDTDITVEATTFNNGFPNQGDNRLVYIAGSALVDRCKIHDISPLSSKAELQGAVQPVGLYSATAILRNTLVSGCTVGADGCTMTAGGGAVFASAGTIENCMISGNKGFSAVGGLYLSGSVVCRNNIVWGNVTSGGALKDIDVAAGKTPSISYTCSSDAKTGDGNVNGDPSLSADYTLPVDSIVAGAGDKTLGWLGDAVDLALNPRLWTDGTVSMGAYEPQGRSKSLVGDFTVTNATLFARAPFAVGFKATVIGASGNETYLWDFGDGTSSTEPEPTHTYTQVGCHTVSLTVTDAGFDPLELVKPGPVTVVGETCYVKAGNAGVRPYDTWEKATSNIEEAVALKPANVIVTNGTYVLSSANGLSLDWPVMLKSVEGPEKTVLDTGLRSVPKEEKQIVRRHLTMTDPAAVVDGFLFDYGINTVISTTDGTIRNCGIRHWLGAIHVQGVVAGDTVIEDCVFDFSHVSREDNNSRLTACGVALDGNSLMDRCVVSNYYATAVEDVKAWEFSGLGAVQLNGHSAIRNSLVSGNVYEFRNTLATAGIAVCGTSNEVANCTVVGNSTKNLLGGDAKGGGIYVTGTDARIYNNVLWANAVNGSSHDADFADSATGLAFGNNLLANVAELPAGAERCVTGADPQFVDDGAGYRITKDSPCYNAGRSLEWCRHRRQATDLDGQERHRHVPDIGCYEVQRDLGLMIFFR